MKQADSRTETRIRTKFLNRVLWRELPTYLLGGRIKSRVVPYKGFGQYTLRDAANPPLLDME